MRSRVMPGSSATIDRRDPTKRLNNVDFPTFGRPTIASVGSASDFFFLFFMAVFCKIDPNAPRSYGNETRVRNLYAEIRLGSYYSENGSLHRVSNRESPFAT